MGAIGFLVVFYFFQAWISPYVLKNRYHLPANLDETIDVRGGLPGISGLQHITTDKNGFRVTSRVDYTRPAPLRIFAIGGSTTEQIYLDDRRTWTHLLQEGLKSQLRINVEVINAGLSGTRLAQQLEVFKEVLSYHPDVALFSIGANDWIFQVRKHFYENGISDVNPDPFRNGWWERFRLRNTILGRGFMGIQRWWVSARMMSPEKVESDTNGNNPLVNIRPENGAYYSKQRNSLARTKRFSYVPKKVDAIYEDSLNSIFKLCREYKVECVFVTQPTGYHPEALEEFRRLLWMTPPNEAYTLDFNSLVAVSQLYRWHLLQVSKLEHFPVVDLAARVEPSYHYFYDDMHFNTMGAVRVAQVLTEALLPIVTHSRSKRWLN